MKTEFDVTVTAKDLFRYKLYHKYHAFSGIFELLLGVVLCVLCVLALSNYETMNISYTILTGVFGLIFLIGLPLQMKLHADNTVKKNTVFQNAMHYELTEEKVIVSQGEDVAEIAWNEIYRIKSTKNYIFIYFTPVRANIIPKHCVPEQIETIKSIARNGMGTYKVKM